MTLRIADILLHVSAAALIALHDTRVIIAAAIADWTLLEVRTVMLPSIYIMRAFLFHHFMTCTSFSRNLISTVGGWTIWLLK